MPLMSNPSRGIRADDEPSRAAVGDVVVDLAGEPVVGMGRREVECADLPESRRLFDAVGGDGASGSGDALLFLDVLRRCAGAEAED
jgi:hypothetical protein